jgi:hypothetical protein
MQKVLEKVLDSSTWGAREIVEGLSRFGEWQIVESVKGPCTDEVKMSYVPADFMERIHENPRLY